MGESTLQSREPNAVIRLFGSTDLGLRICAHIHGFVPYIYFRPEEMHDVVFETEESLAGYLSRMEKALEELLRKRYESNTSSSNRLNFKRIKKLEIVRRKTLYGFYDESFLFVKVFLRDPNDISKLSAILDEGGLCGILMQAYEGHIPYLLKFTSDLSISPMGWITLKEVQFRSQSNPNPNLEKESSCELEVDAHFRDIELLESQGFGSELWEEERLRCERKRLEPDRQPTPPSTITNHRTKTSSECNYILRLRNLMEKGQALMRVNQHIQTIVVHPSTPPTNLSPVMSQIGQAIANSPSGGALKSRSISFKNDSIDANDSSRLFSSPSPSVLGSGLGLGMLSPDILRHTPESNVYRWVVSTIKKTEEQVVQSGQLFDRLLTEDPVIVAEEFMIRSQVSEGQNKDLQNNNKITLSGNTIGDSEVTSGLHGATIVGSNGVSVYAYNINDKAADVDDDEVLTAEEIHTEVENILQSTQPADALAATSHLNKASSHHHHRQSIGIAESNSSGNQSLSINPRINVNDKHDDGSGPNKSSLSKPPLPRIRTEVNHSRISSHIGSEDSSFSPDVHFSSLQPDSNLISFVNDSPSIPSSSPYLRIDKRNSNLTLGSVFNPYRKRKITGGISNAAVGSPADMNAFDPAITLFPGESPPIGIAQVDDNVRSALKSSSKKINRTVSFLEPNPSPSSFSPHSIPRPYRHDTQPVEENAIFDSYPYTSDSPIAVSFSESVRQYESLILQPTFDAPVLSQLTPIHVYGLPDLVNPPIVWSNRADAIQAGDTSTALQSIISRHAVKYKYDTDEFDGGFPDLPDDDQERGRGNSKKKLPNPVARVRCLVPLFTPPPPNIFWQKQQKDGDDGENRDPKSDKSFSPASPAVSHTQKYAKSQINSPTQTQVRVMKLAGGIATPREDLIGKGNLTSKKSRTAVMSVEILCEVRQGYLPNPKFDPVKCICWIINDKVSDSESESTQRYQGIICVDPQAIQTEKAAHTLMVKYKSCGLPPLCDIQLAATEAQLFQLFINIVGQADPDFFIGYDINRNSFGFLVKRGKVININLLQLLSKVPNEPPNFRNNTGEDEDSMYGQGEPSILIAGRILLNLWNYMRSELKLMSYTYMSVAEHVLSVSVPYYTASQLSRWFHSAVSRHRALRHLYKLTELNLLLIEKVDLVRKTAECARLYGIDFTSVLTRGSQYRVEASLLKKAHAFGYLLITPSRRRVAAQAPMEVIPLVMEPQSGFYKDPVVVLDFQSLYPSMIIAYNLCYSTCIGKMIPLERRKVENFDGEDVEVETTGRLGAVRYPEVQSALSSIMHHRNPTLNERGRDYGPDGPSIQDLADSDNAPYVSPNGSAFCSKSVRLGILPMMCKEMLETRIMLKRAMKRHKDESGGILSKVLDARQLAVKLLSNVTYGYTAAGFSGRMPMAELADAVVQSGRSTLEWTIQYIQNHPDWRARVVYGDTDSVFVELPGRSKEDAFRIGNVIAQEITAKSPADVLLKFEKVYYPCVLVTKKRYVGSSFETVAQPPHLDAKGIEMVRRDQCPAAMKMQEKALRLLFETRDGSCVKKYLLSQWEKMVQGGDRLLLRDFIFRKEVRFGHYANISSQPPGAIVATKQVLLDDMAVPPYNWRVPYVVVHGVPNAPLKNLVFSPEEVLRRGSPLRVNYSYYIHKCINPALDRVLSLCGLDVGSWFRGMARPRQRLRHFNYDTMGSTDERNGAGNNHLLARRKQTTMDQFTTRGSCEICCERDALPQRSLCGHCSDNRMNSLIILTERMKSLEIKSQVFAEICHDCAQCLQPADLFVRGQMVGSESCESVDCVVFHERCRLVTRMEDAKISVAEIEDLGR